VAPRGFLTALLCACASQSSAPPLGDTDAAINQQLSATIPCSFNASSAIALPPAGGVTSPFVSGTTGTVACQSGTGSFDYTVVDMNGDTKQDLVVTQACDDASITPSTAWLVYLNDSTGAFGAPLKYVLPVLSTTPGCITETVVDVDGDLKPDLLVTSSCLDASVGTTQWLLYVNTGTAFDLTAQSFALPSAGPQGNATRVFASLEQASEQCSTPIHPAYAFVDVTGDLKPDFVMTQACDDSTVGITHWRVYENDGMGATTLVNFTLPTNSTFASPRGGTMSCTLSAPTPGYTVVDFNGDLKPDLVVTKSCADASAGVTQWLVYLNTGSSFGGTPLAVNLPVRGATTSAPFDTTQATVSCTGGAKQTHALVDVNGDYKPDLVLTQDCSDGTVGVGVWLVLLNSGSAFGTPMPYALPPVIGATTSAPAGFSGGSLGCSGATHAAFGASHFLGQELDLVVTATCTDQTVGTSRWLVAHPECTTSN
jgi:FG-GAP-like repeat